MDLISESETASVPGATTLPTEAFPNRPAFAAGTANAAGLRNTGPAELVKPCTARGETPGTTSARVTPTVFRMLVLAGSTDVSDIVRNAPLWNTTTPPNCHPPTAASI